MVDCNQLEIEQIMFIKQFYEKTKLPFGTLLPLPPFFDVAASQRVPKVPSAFFSIWHRCLGPQSFA